MKKWVYLAGAVVGILMTAYFIGHMDGSVHYMSCAEVHDQLLKAEVSERQLREKLERCKNGN